MNLTELSDKLRSYISDVYKDASGGSEIDINVGQLPQILMVDGAINSVIIKDVTITYQNLKTDYFHSSQRITRLYSLRRLISISWMMTAIFFSPSATMRLYQISISTRWAL